jgi:hypothetical protein
MKMKKIEVLNAKEISQVSGGASDRKKKKKKKNADQKNAAPVKKPAQGGAVRIQPVSNDLLSDEFAVKSENGVLERY